MKKKLTTLALILIAALSMLALCACNNGPSSEEVIREGLSGELDTIVNKKLITASNIFRFTMSTDVQAIKCLTGCDAEVLEFIVKPNSPATKVKIRDLNFPHDATIGGIVRGDRTFIAVGNTEINAYDRVVVFSLPSAISKIGKFFN